MGIEGKKYIGTMECSDCDWEGPYLSRNPNPPIKVVAPGEGHECWFAAVGTAQDVLERVSDGD